MRSRVDDFFDLALVAATCLLAAHVAEINQSVHEVDWKVPSKGLL